MNYAEMNVASLKSECKGRKIVGYSKLRKAELVDLLVAHDKANTPEPTEAAPIAQPVVVKGRAVGATTAAVEAVKVARVSFKQYPNTTARNVAKRRRRKLRAQGFQAGF